MKHHVFAAALLLAAAMQGREAYGGWLTGNQLLAACSDMNVIEYQLCMGYVIGIADSMISRPDAIANACFARGMQRGQLIAVVKNYLTAHPEQLHYQADALVTVALARAFPCSP